jgi:CBS domain-containing protein
MKVINLLEMKGKEVYKIQENETVFTALQLLAKHDVGALIVTDKKDNIIGIFSERDYARKVIGEGKSTKSTRVKDMMTTTIYFVKPENSLWDCLNLMTKKRTRHMPVIQNKQLTGLVSIGDIVNRIITEQKSTIENLESYIIGSDYGATIKMPS